MISVPQKVEELIRESAYQSVSIRVEPLKGEPFYITSQDIEEGSFTIQRDCISGSELEIGNMTASELKMTLRNPYDAWGFGKYDHIAFCGAKLTCTLRIHDASDDSMYEIPYGVFTVDQQPRMLENIEIAALDNLMRLDIPFDGSKLPEELSVQYLVREGISKAGLDCPEEDLKVFPDYHGLEDAMEMRQAILKSVVNPQNITSKNTLTWRQVIMWCCQCAGVCGYADMTGAVRFRFYQKYTPDVLQSEDGENLLDEDGELLLLDDTPQGDFELPASARFMDGSDLEESDVVLTGHQFKEEDTLYPADAVMDYGLQTEGNLVFAAAATPERAKPNFAALANDAVAGFTYRPFSCSTLSFPQLEPMDGIDYVKNGRHYHSVVMSMTFKLNGEMKLAAKAKSRVQKGYASLGALTPGQQVIIDSISQSMDKTHLQLTDYENALLLFNEQMFNAMGLYKTTEEKNGGIIVYFHDAPTLEESETIYMFGSNGFAWTENGWQGGEPVWNYGVTSGGEALLSKIHAYVISAELIKTGRLQSQNGASWIDMDDGTFCFGYFDKWLDIDTGETEEEYRKALELKNKELNIYGTLRGIQYPNLSLSIGRSPNWDVGAFTVTDSEKGDLFTVETAEDGEVVRLGFPMLEVGRYATRGINVSTEEMEMRFSQDGGDNGRVYCKKTDAGLSSNNAFFRAYRDQFNFSTISSHTHCWFNYYAPAEGNTPTAFCFGNGEGDYGNVICRCMEAKPNKNNGEFAAYLDGRITVGGTTAWKDTALNVTGGACIDGSAAVTNKLAVGDSAFYGEKLSVFGSARADQWVVNSDPAIKDNILEQNPNALSKLLDLKFYSYNINPSKVQRRVKLNSITEAEAISEENEEIANVSLSHVKMGIMTSDAPEEIVTEDGTGISLYSYISMCAKSIQELNAKVEEQEQKIAILESKLAKLEA